MPILGSWRSPALVMGGLWLVLVTAWPSTASAQSPEGEAALLLLLGLTAADTREVRTEQERVPGLGRRRQAQARRSVVGAPKVNLNTATQEELETLSGIGPATAKRIIAGRPYASIAELSRAQVAGPIIERIGPHVVVVAPRAGAPPYR